MRKGALQKRGTGRYSQILFAAILIVVILSCSSRSQNKPWVSAYYAGWQLGDGKNGYLPLSAVDCSSVTDVVLFSLQPQSNGGLDSTGNSLTPAGTASLVGAAHAVGTKALISIGGWATESAFLGATSPTTLGVFVANLVAYMTGHGFDGIDIDWEPLGSGDEQNFTNLAAALSQAVKNSHPAAILTTTCVSGNQALMSSDQQYFDRINIMTYDMSGNYPGWVSWYNSPIYNGGNTFPGTSEYLPAIDTDVGAFKAAGVSPAKIGIGAELGGTIWQGLTFPLQLLTALTSISYDVPLYASDGSGIMQQYYSDSYYHWDSQAQAGYLSVPSLLGLTGSFISYDDTNSIKAKAAYIQQKGLGGIILYELGMGYPGHGSYPMLQSVKNAFGTGGRTGVDSGTSEIPVAITLDQNFPNPFNPQTTIRFTLPASGYVRLRVFNVLGEEVAVLVDGWLQAGSHRVTWDAAPFPSGVYLCRLEDQRHTGSSIKMLLMK